LSLVRFKSVLPGFLSVDSLNRNQKNVKFCIRIALGIDLSIYGKQLAQEIIKGLEDFCSQTRVTAAIACRKFLLSLTEKERETYYKVMLPPLCLNRYYMADAKFLLYSQETWKTLFGTRGPELVATYIDSVVNDCDYLFELIGSKIFTSAYMC